MNALIGEKISEPSLPEDGVSQETILDCEAFKNGNAEILVDLGQIFFSSNDYAGATHRGALIID
jgi:hypothetical protein